MAAGGGAAKLVVEAQDAIDVGARKVERIGDDDDRRIGNEPELVLDGVENLEKLVGAVAVRSANGTRPLLTSRGNVDDLFTPDRDISSAFLASGGAN